MTFYQRYIYNRERRLTLCDTNRQIFPFEWGLEWLDGSDKDEDPLTCLKGYAEKSLQESPTFFRPPPIRNWRLQNGLLTFSTPTLTSYPGNNTVYCRVFPAPNSRKAVIVLPQWNSDARSHIVLCRILQTFGVTAARLTLPYHEQRLPPGLKRADYLVSPNIGRTLHATRQAVLEVRQLADWLWQQGYRRIAVMGTSLGSCVAFLAFAHDPLICTGVFNHISSFFADVVWTGLSTRYVRWGLQRHISLEDLRHCWSPISPWHFIRRLKERPRPHLLISAAYDLSFLPALSDKVFEEYHAQRVPLQSVRLPCGHYTTATFPFNCLDGWHICRHLVGALS